MSPGVSRSHPKESRWITEGVNSIVLLSKTEEVALLKTTLHMPGIPSDRTTGQKQMLD